MLTRKSKQRILEIQKVRKYRQIVMSTQILDLQKISNHYLIVRNTNIRKLKNFVSFMRDKRYLDFNFNDQGDKMKQKIQDFKATKLIQNELEKLSPVYIHLLVDRKIQNEFVPCDPLLLKLRVSPYEDHVYFSCFHDLESLKKIQQEPLLDSHDFLMKEVRNRVFLEPSRQKMQEDARIKLQELKIKQSTTSDKSDKLKQNLDRRFKQFPSESQGQSAQEFAQSIFSIDDLEIDYQGYEKEDEEEVQDMDNMDITDEREAGGNWLDKFKQLEMEMRQLSEEKNEEENEEEAEMFW